MAPPQSKPCYIEGCTFTTTIGIPTYEMLMRDLEMHLRCVHPELQPQHVAPVHPPGPKPDRLPRPTVGEGITEADWMHFSDKWNRYKRSTLTGASPQHISDQLWACCDPELETSVYNTGVNSDSDEATLLAAMRKLAVRAQNTLVNVVKFLDMAQEQEEAAGAFTARLKGQASICNFLIKCSSNTCTQETNYADQMVCHQLVRGLADPTIQEQMLAHGADNADLDLAKTLKFVEAKEAGKRSSNLLTTAGGLNKMSEFQKAKFENKKQNLKPVIPDNNKCGWCGQAGHGGRATMQVRKEKCKSFKHVCEVCSAVGHYGSMCRSKKKTNPELGALSEQISLGDGNFCNFNMTGWGKKKKLTLPHTAYDQYRGWVASKPEGHPELPIGACLCTSGYEQLGIPTPRMKNRLIKTISLPDTGAQMTVVGMRFIHSLGLTKSELIPLSHGVNAANNLGLGLLGGALVTFSGSDCNGNTRTSKQLCYVAETIDSVFLSRSACVDLGLISKNFPTIGAFNTPNINAMSETDSDNKDAEDYLFSPSKSCKDTVGSKNNSMPDSRVCTCPRRELPPAVPNTLPLPATPENREKLKDWILKQYASSAFNQCEHQPLPLMRDSPPIKLHVDPKAKPFAIHKSRPVPIHWREQVKAELERDVRLGVLERVPIGEPTDWCSPMVICPKTNGDPRRTVDLQALNHVSVRQTHPSDSPFHQALSVPKHTIKTVVDAWQGYHSVPLADEDRHYTTFLTPWGKFRYRTCPQGFLASGDAFNARYDKIVEEFKDITKCIDDTLLWSNNLEESFFRTCEYLSLCSSSGVIFNKKKFQFGQEEVNFLGFKITMDSIKPNPEYLQAILDFPRPRDITGVRSWFGLIQQVAYAFSNAEVMLPFRNLLKPSTEFLWTQELQNSFDKSKDEIVKAVENGVKIYDPSKTTALCTDWSKTGIGFMLLQKECMCETITPVCCPAGWTLIYAGSRFTSPAESRYAPVEGECLAAVWALEKTKYFTLGAPDLLLAVDHKPLLKILGNKELQEIDNPRLQNLKEKTLRYRFRLVHVPGKDHKGADFTSRNPTSPSDHMHVAALTIASLTEHVNTVNEAVRARPGRTLVAGMRQPVTLHEETQALLVEQDTLGSTMSYLAALSHANSSVQALTVERINSASSSDPVMSALVSLIQLGCPEDKAVWPKELQTFHQFREQLTTIDCTVLFRGRAVIPKSLQAEALEILHSGHQGVTAMTAIASESVFWPGISDAIVRCRLVCRSCDKVTPSHPSSPPYPLPQPTFPFEMVCTDYFSFAGKSYYIVVDRYSGWLSIYKAGNDGAAGFISTMKEYFSTFGISQQVSSDGGTQYTSQKTQKFFKDWGITHRLSSSYFPHSNQRAEQGVKSAKRMLRDNIAPNGSLNTDRFLRALLLHRNTPDRDTGLSPAQVIFGRSIRDFFPIKPGNLLLHPEWRLTMEQREKALARRHARRGKDLTEHTKVLAPLAVGQVVLVQNQSGNNPLRWDRSGQIVEILPFDQYRIKMDGTGRSSLRNRKFLRAITPFSNSSRETSSTTPYTSLANDLEVNTENDAAAPTSPIAEHENSDTDTAPTTRRSTRTSKPPVRLGLGSFTCSRSSQGGEHR